MIFLGIGANLPSRRFGAPMDTCEAACAALNALGAVDIVARSSWFESAPVPMSDQPWYINGVVQVKTNLTPFDLLQTLHKIEEEFGRVRAERNAPRILDLDILAYDDLHLEGVSPQIPHPRLQDRAFVVLPLAQLVPHWVHPVTREALEDMVKNLPDDQVCRALT